jgi:hypothetical protein
MNYRGGMTPEEAAGLVPDGDYPFRIKKAVDTKSKSNNDMMKIEIVLHRDNKPVGKDVRDYILDAMPEKLRNFFVTTGKLAEYDASTPVAAEQFINLAGIAKIKVESQPGFRPKNVVVDYIARPEGFVVPPELEITPDPEDVPF